MLKVMIDAGHGAGVAHNRGGVCFNEGDNNYRYSLVLKAELEKYEGIKVDLTRNKITDNPSLTQRRKLGKGYDLYLSQHSNASNGKVRGTEVWDSVERPNKELAGKISIETSKLFKHTNRGVKYREGQPGYNWYAVLRFNEAKSSMIIENGFHDNKLDCTYFKNNHKVIAEVQAQVIAEHYKLREGKGDPISNTDKGGKVVEWKEEIFNKTKKEYGIEDSWLWRLDESAPVWLIFELMNRVSDKLEEE